MGPFHAHAYPCAQQGASIPRTSRTAHPYAPQDADGLRRAGALWRTPAPSVRADHRAAAACAGKSGPMAQWEA